MNPRGKYITTNTVISVSNLRALFRNGTSFVSLYIPPKETITKVSQMLGQELAGADNIKSRQTRQSVQSAITSCKESKFNSNS